MKQKFFTFAVIFFFFGIGLVALILKTSRLTPIEPPNAPAISNPFEQNEDNAKQLVASYGFGYAEENPQPIFTQAALEIPMIYQNSKLSTSVATLFFLDGIAQEYSSLRNTNSTSLEAFSLSAEETRHITYQIEPMVFKAESSKTLYAVSMLNPEYCATPEQPVFGNQHSISYVMPITVHFNKQPSFSDSPIMQAPDGQIATDAFKKSFSIPTSNENSIQLLNQDDTLRGTYRLSKNGLKLELIAYGNLSTSATYRISFYVNHKLVSYNSETVYLDVTLKKEQLNRIPITLQAIQEGDFVYAIAVPINTTDLQFQPIKTPTMLVVSDEESISIEQSAQTKTNGPSQFIAASAEYQYFLETDDKKHFFAENEQNEVVGSTVLADTDLIAQTKIFSNSIGLLLHSFLPNGKLQMDRIAYYTKELVPLFEINLQGIFPQDTPPASIDFDEQQLIFVLPNENEILYRHDFSTHTTQSVAHLKEAAWPGIHSAFTQVALMGKDIAFSGFALQHDDTNIPYIGVLNLQQQQYHSQKSPEKFFVSANASTAVWWDKNLDWNEQSSGEIAVYQNGLFSTFSTQDKNESQQVVLSNNSSHVATLLPIYENGQIASHTVRIYQAGILHKEHSLKGNAIPERLFLTEKKMTLALYEGEKSSTHFFSH